MAGKNGASKAAVAAALGQSPRNHRHSFDPTGAVVPSRQRHGEYVGTNQSVRMKTSQADPVLYKVPVEAPGFKQSIVENVKVDTATKSCD